MSYIVLAIIFVVACLIILFLRENSAYYRKIFSDDHYTEVGNWLVSVLKLGPVAEPNVGDGSAFQSSTECAFTFTREVGERDTIHIAISQIGNPTTHAVCDRLAFLILQVLKRNKAEADFFYTASSIHHLVFVKDAGGEWLTNEIGPVVADMKSHQPVPFRFQAEQGA